MLCRDCKQYITCIQLCPEAEAYVNQDAPNYHRPNELHFTPIERKILNLLISGKTRSEIRKILNLSKDTLKVHISNLRKKGKEIVL